MLLGPPTDHVHRVYRRDRINEASKHPLRLLQQLLGAPAVPAAVSRFLPFDTRGPVDGTLSEAWASQKSFQNTCYSPTPSIRRGSIEHAAGIALE
jgi:hypothetical protein